jgi:hypothetical protein
LVERDHGTLEESSFVRMVGQPIEPRLSEHLVESREASTPPDIISRILAKELSEGEGWRVIVENRPGGVTTIAAGDVFAAAPRRKKNWLWLCKLTSRPAAKLPL